MLLKIWLDGRKMQILLQAVNKSMFEIVFDHKKYQVKLLSRLNGEIHFQISNKKFTAYISEQDSGSISISVLGYTFEIVTDNILNPGEAGSDPVGIWQENDKTITAPMPGKVIKVFVEEGQKVKEGDTLLILEAMKMENKIQAARCGTLEKLNVITGQMIESGAVLAIYSDEN